MRSRSSATTAAYRVARLACMASGLVAGAGSAALEAFPSHRPAAFRADVLLLGVNHRPGHPAEAAPDPQSDLRARQVAAIECYLRHACTIYLGLKACAELRTERTRWWRSASAWAASFEMMRPTCKTCWLLSKQVLIPKDF